MGKSADYWYPLIIPLLLLTFGCESTRGTLHVGQPQVHTREGLVGERVGELEWLEKQLDKSDDIALTFQGVQDVRTFVGLYNQLKGTFDPTQGRLNQLQLENEETRIRTDLWNRRTAEKLAEDKFNKVQDQIAKGNVEEGANTKDTVPAAKQEIIPPPLPSGTAPLGTKASEFVLPDPKGALETRARPNILDLFHDQMTYRDTVNAAIKSTRLDDAHDRKGSMLYELTFNMALVPGNRSEEYAQILLSINSEQDGRKRELALKDLFLSWRSALQNKIISEVSALQHRYRTQTLTANDSSFLEWFFSEYIHGLSFELKQRDHAINKFLETDSTEEGTQTPKNSNGEGEASAPSKPNIKKYLEGTEELRKNQVNPFNVIEVKKRFFELINHYQLYFLLNKEILEFGNNIVKKPAYSWEFDRNSAYLILKNLRDFVSSNQSDGAPRSEFQSRSTQLRQLVTKILSFDPPTFFQNIKSDCAIPSSPTESESRSSMQGREKDFATDGVGMCPLKGSRSLSGPHHEFIYQGIAWAIWSKYRELANIVGISEPYFKDQKKIELSGLTVNLIPAAISEAALKDIQENSPCFAGSPDAQIIPQAWNISHTGFCTFLERITEVEEKPYVLIIEPKEYAQNISEVSAREDMLNLIASVNAMLPTQGLNIEDNIQYVRRQQELLHAINRRPLIVGFGQGGKRFGWIVGPKFGLEDGKVMFRHVPIRHDFSASIVVPAWWNYVYLTGAYNWIDWKGRPQKGGCLWHVEGKRKKISTMVFDSCETSPTGKNTIELSLPAPNDQMDRITNALLSFGANPNVGPAQFQPRPHPVITFPDRNLGSQVSIQGIKKKTDGIRRQILIRGKELWRNPQVFLGSQQASKVEVLSDMEGLLAHFDILPYIEEVHKNSQVDLRVVTTFGSALSPQIATILPPPTEEAIVEPGSRSQAQLIRSFVDNKNKIVQFSIDKPKSYAKTTLNLKDKSGNTEKYEEEKWDKKDEALGFEITLPSGLGDGDVVEVDLIQIDRKNGPGRSILGKQKPSLARFSKEEHRFASLLPPTIITFPATSSTTEKIQVSFPKDLLDVLDVAYPGFKEARANGVYLSLSPKLDIKKKKKISTTIHESPDGKDVIFTGVIEDKAISPLREDLKKLGEEFLVQLEYETTDKDKKNVVLYISTLKDGTTDPGIIKFIWASPEDIKPEIMNGTIKYDHAGGTDDSFILFVKNTQLKHMFEKYPGLKESLGATQGSDKVTLRFKDSAGSLKSESFALEQKADTINLKLITPENLLNQEPQKSFLMGLKGKEITLAIEYSKEKEDGAWPGERETIDVLKDGKTAVLTVQDQGPIHVKLLSPKQDFKFKTKNGNVTTTDKIEFILPFSDEKKAYRYYEGFKSALDENRAEIDQRRIWVVALDATKVQREGTSKLPISDVRDESHDRIQFLVESNILISHFQQIKEWADQGYTIGLQYYLGPKPKIVEITKSGKDEPVKFTVSGP